MPPKVDRIRVLLVIRNLAGRGGGAERIYCELANLLADEGFDVTCASFDAKDGMPFFPLDPRVYRINLHPAKLNQKLMHFATRVFPRGTGLGNRLRWKMQNDDFVAQLGRLMDGWKPDLAISFLPPANTPTLLAARNRAVKVIPTNHNVPAEDYTNPRRWDANPVDRKLRLSALDRADAIHVLFPGFAGWFPAHLRDRITAIPNYVSDDILKSPEAPERDRTILAAGRLASVKDYGTLLSAWALLPQHHATWKVKVFGDGPERAMLTDRIAQFGVQDSFLLCGHTSAIAEEYRKASIFCHPAKFEGFGLSPAEALACGTPVVAFAGTPGIKEFLVHDGNALLCARDERSTANLAEALDRLISDNGLRERLARNGPESMLPYSYDRYRATWVSLIHRVLKGVDRDHA